MDPLVFRAALRATARVAFTAALVGCGGTAIGGNVGPTPGADTGTTGSDDANVATNGDSAPPAEAGTVLTEAAPPADSGLACNTPPPTALFPKDAMAGVDTTTVSESMFQCCMAELTPLIATDSGTDSPDAAAADPNVVACCGVVVFAVDHDITSPDAGPDAGQVAAFDQLGWSARSTCCNALSWPSGPTCTPWGPPAPPAMPGEADLAASGAVEVA